MPRREGVQTAGGKLVGELAGKPELGGQRSWWGVGAPDIFRAWDRVEKRLVAQDLQGQ
jgi:hypothetical protein